MRPPVRSSRIPFARGWQPGGGQHQADDGRRETDALAKILLFRTELHAPDPAVCSAEKRCTRVGTSRGGACTCLFGPGLV